MRLIDADALGVGRCSRDLLPADYCAGWNGLVGLIEEAPTIDAVPVVRCRDCVHGELCTNLAGAEYVVCEQDEYHVWLPNGYCSYGERRSHHDSLCDQEDACANIENSGTLNISL